jgi:transposase
MPDEQNLLPATKAAILKAAQEKTPYSPISKKFDVSKSTISYIMKLFRQTDDDRCHFTSGRPQATSDEEDKILIRPSNQKVQVKFAREHRNWTTKQLLRVL